MVVTSCTARHLLAWLLAERVVVAVFSRPVIERLLLVQNVLLLLNHLETLGRLKISVYLRRPS